MVYHKGVGAIPPEAETIARHEVARHNMTVTRSHPIIVNAVALTHAYCEMRGEVRNWAATNNMEMRVMTMPILPHHL